MNTFNLNLLQKFCKTHNTLYLDRMNIFFIQYLYNFVQLNNQLQNKKIGKIIKIYVKQRNKVELNNIKTTNNVSNSLPIVLITVLKYMLNTLTYTQKQKIVYKNISQYIEKQKMQSNILKFGGGYSDSLELNADENAIIIGNHSGIMEGQNWNTKSYWKKLQENLNSDVFKIIVIDRGSASWLDSKMHSYITNFINNHIADDGIVIFEQYLFEHIIDYFSTYNKYVIYPQNDHKNLQFDNFLWLLSKTPIYSKYVINVDSPNDLTYKNKIFSSSKVRTQIASEALSLTNLYKLIINNDLSTPKCDITGLNYNGNSCYMDTVLLCTFAIPNKTITDNILDKDLDVLKTYPVRWSICDSNLDVDINKRKDIQTVIKNITMSMRGLKDIKTCSNLRKLIQSCPGPQNFHETDPQDSGEFLTYLFNMFQVNIANTEITTYGSNELTKNPEWTLESKEVDDNASPIINVDSTTLINVKNSYDITQFIKEETDALLGDENKWTPKRGTSYIRKKQIFEVTESPIIIFNLLRTYGEQVIRNGNFVGIKAKNVWKKVNAPESMLIKDKTLYLTSIVIHNGGGHYVSVFKCERNWFYYDDNPGSSTHIIKYIGSYEKMLEIHPNPSSHGTLFFYT